MGFESGALSVSMFYLQRRLPEDMVASFAEHALPPIDTLGKGAIGGWVTGRHLLDRNITEDSAHVAVCLDGGER